MNENHPSHSEAFKSSRRPADSVQTLSSWRDAISTALTLNYTQCFGESPHGIPVPVLGVKGLISCSWLGECNCFCVCEKCVCGARCHELWCWKPLANTSEKWSVSPCWDHSQMCMSVCVSEFVFRLGSPANVLVPDGEKFQSSGSLRNKTPAGLLMWHKAPFFNFSRAWCCFMMMI